MISVILWLIVFEGGEDFSNVLASVGLLDYAHDFCAFFVDEAYCPVFVFDGVYADCPADSLADEVIRQCFHLSPCEPIDVVALLFPAMDDSIGFGSILAG